VVWVLSNACAKTLIGKQCAGWDSASCPQICPQAGGAWATGGGHGQQRPSGSRTGTASSAPAAAAEPAPSAAPQQRQQNRHGQQLGRRFGLRLDREAGANRGAGPRQAGNPSARLRPGVGSLRALSDNACPGNPSLPGQCRGAESKAGRGVPAVPAVPARKTGVVVDVRTSTIGAGRPEPIPRNRFCAAVTARPTAATAARGEPFTAPARDHSPQWVARGTLIAQSSGTPGHCRRSRRISAPVSPVRAAPRRTAGRAARNPALRFRHQGQART
jgi:hypothetical protein